MALADFDPESDFVAYARSCGWLGDADFGLLDVGASGGIDRFWRQFEPNLRAVGFDPLASEVERLNAAEAGDRVRYVPAWITSGSQGLEAWRHPEAEETPNAFTMTSAQRVYELAEYDVRKEVFNSGDELRYTDTRMSLDMWCAEHPEWTTDFLKIDVDGYDLHALRGADALLSGDRRPLGILTEAQLHDPHHTPGVAFGEIDVYLRARGYRLFDLDLKRYSRYGLPQPFCSDMIAETVAGGVQACDALYFLDPCLDDAAFARLQAQADRRGFQKLVMLFAGYTMPDCAAQVLMTCRERGVSLGGVDPDAALDRLATPNVLGARSHAEYLAAFESDPGCLFPSRLRKSDLEHESVDDWLPELKVAAAGRRDGGLIVTDRDGGHACFGPYRRLAPGRYRLRGAVVVTAGRADAEIVAELVVDEALQQSQTLPGDTPGIRRIEIAFELTASAEAPAVQLRLFNPPGVSLVLAELALSGRAGGDANGDATGDAHGAAKKSSPVVSVMPPTGIGRQTVLYRGRPVPEGLRYATPRTPRGDVRSLIRSLHPRRSPRELIRLGARDDGGYLVPDDLAGIGACFSPGVHHVSAFETDCANRGMPVFMADQSVDGPAVDHPGFTFTKKFVGASASDTTLTMDDWVRASVPDTEGDLLLQMDIEGAEFESLLSMSTGLMNRFRIAVIEFHDLQLLWDRPYYERTLEPTFRKLAATHTCVHLHPNNYSPVIDEGGIAIPPLLEATFLRNDRLDAAAGEQFATAFPHPQDRDNTPPRPTVVLPENWYGGG